MPEPGQPLHELPPETRAELARHLIEEFGAAARDQWTEPATEAIVGLRPVALVGVMVSYGPGPHRERRIITAMSMAGPELPSEQVQMQHVEAVLAETLESLLLGRGEIQNQFRRVIGPEGRRDG